MRTRVAAPPSWRESHSRSAADGSIVMAHRFSASCDLLLGPHALAREGARHAVLLGDLADDRPVPARGRGQPQRRRHGGLPDAALSRHVEQRAVQQCGSHGSDSMTGEGWTRPGSTDRPWMPRRRGAVGASIPYIWRRGNRWIRVQLCFRPTGPAGGCTGGTTRPTTGRRGACRATSARPPTRSTGTSAPQTRSSTARAGGRTGRAAGGARRLGGRAGAGARRGAVPHPVVGALVDAGLRHRLPLGELRTYMRSMRVDCGPVRIATWPELEAYMDGSAGSVGRIMAKLLGVPARHHGGYGRLGQAFQLTNFIRDLREDRQLDRIYLPADERARFGVRAPTWGSRCLAGAARARRLPGPARARAVRGGRARGGGGAALRAPGVRLAVARLPPRARPRGGRRVRRARAARGVRAWQLPGARPRRSPVTRRATLRGAGRTPLRRARPTS